MKKILFINTLYSPNIGGGAEIIFQEQVEAFSRKGYQVVVLTTGKEKGLKIDIISGIKVYRAKIENIYWHFTEEKSKNKYIRMIWHLKDMYNKEMNKHVKNVINLEQPDIAICHNIAGFSISIWDELKAANIRIIQVLHDLYLMCPGSNMFKNGQACQKQCRICCYMRKKHIKKSQKVDSVIGVSNYVLNRLKENGYFKNVPSHVIYNARNIPEISNSLSWNGKDSLNIGYIGTLSKVKGVEWLINQFMELDINATLTIAGRGESEDYEKYLKQLAAKDNRIKFTGYVKPKDHYANIHISIIPSKGSDSFPTVAFESCAYNVPVIATDIGGLPEIIKSGKNGWLIDWRDPDSLGKTILVAYESPDILQEYSFQAREEVRILTDTERVISEYINIIDK